MKKLLATFIFLFLAFESGFSQCAMCRATLETSISNGNSTELASTLNFAILYLLALPYVLVIGTGLFVYKKARKAGEGLLLK